MSGGPPAAPRPQVRLSTGVALAQTGPTGIMMCFSVDYELLGPPTGTASEFVWFIRRSHGSPDVLARPVALAARGTLQTTIPEWRPEEGPFETWIETVSGSRRRSGKWARDSLSLDRPPRPW